MSTTKSNASPKPPSINRDQILTRGDLEDFKADFMVEIKSLLKELRIEPTRAWLRSKEVRKMLNISPGTLQAFRINRVISYSMLGKIPYYKHEEIMGRLEKNLVSKLP